MIDDLDPTVATLCRQHVALCAAQGVTLAILRTRPVTPSGDSRYDDGFAYDAAPLLDNGTADITRTISPDRRTAGAAAQSLGLTWGGDSDDVLRFSLEPDG